MSNRSCKSKQNDKVSFHLNCPNDIKRLCELACYVCPPEAPVPQPTPTNSGALLDFSGQISNISGTGFNLLLPFGHSNAAQPVVIPLATSIAQGSELLIPGAQGDTRVIQGMRLLALPALVGVTFVLRVNQQLTNLRVSTTNPVSQGTVTVQAGDLVSVVADLTGIPTSALLGFATVTMNLV